MANAKSAGKKESKKKKKEKTPSTRRQYTNSEANRHEK